MKNRFKLIALAGIVVAAFAVWGCATTTGGQTDPILSKLIPNTLSDYGPTLAGNCINSCNTGACQEYGANMAICANPTQFIAQIPGNPFVTPATIASAITAVCNTNGYTSSAAPTVTAGNCVYPAPSAVATSAAVKAK